MNSTGRKRTSAGARAYLDPQRIDWNLLKSFCAVADMGSLTAAAGVLGMSQPTLSRQMTELEELLGAALFERVARGLRLTDAGNAMLPAARHMLAAAQAVSLAAAGQDRAVEGTVRITASEVMSAFVLPPILAALRKTYPAIQIELVASNRIDNLLEREADIAIRMVRPTQAGLISKKVADYPLGFYAHKRCAAGVRPGKANSLAQGLDWIGLDQSNQLIEGFRAAGWKIDRSFFSFRCDNQIVGWHAVLAGLGVGIGMKRVARQYPDLVQVMKDQKVPDLPVWLTAHRELRDSPRIRAVFDFLTDGLAGTGTAP